MLLLCYSSDCLYDFSYSYSSLEQRSSKQRIPSSSSLISNSSSYFSSFSLSDLSSVEFVRNVNSRNNWNLIGVALLSGVSLLKLPSQSSQTINEKQKMSNAGSITQVLVHSEEDESHKQMCLTQNSILKVTLDGKALGLTILSIIIAVQVLQPSITCTLIAFLPLPWIIHNDFQNFLLLGPGGTPSTFVGYLKITYLRLFALSDTYTLGTISGKVYPDVGLYRRASSWLPQRSGPRPKIAGIAPHRQINQPGCKHMDRILRNTLQNLAVTHPDSFRIGQSCFEKRGLALFARDPINATCRGEICHIHHLEGSMHMNLHPDDAMVVLEKGWGERHPLARGGWMKQYVPREFTSKFSIPRRLTSSRANLI